jgi:16S rRNA pseudouridine516 synthase
MRGVRLDKLLSNLGYGSRKEVAAWAKQGRLSDAAGRPLRNAAERMNPEDVRLDGLELDPRELLLLMNKPAGYTCSHRDRPPLVFDLLPSRYHFREPAVSCVGRLDKDTTGALVLTDHGQLLHRLTAPTWKLPKVYQVQTELPVMPEQVRRLAEGGWCLPDDDKPLAPAECRHTGVRSLELVLTEGRFHQVKRMLEAVGNPVTALHRSSFAGLEVEVLAPGQWRPLHPDERAGLLARCGLKDG